MGDACAELRHQLDISYPVNNGIVQNWEDMCHVWDHTFYDELKAFNPHTYRGFVCSILLLPGEKVTIFCHFLQIDPTECKILLTDPPLNPSKNREKMVTCFFLP